MTDLAELTRPIIGIENRTAQEVFDMMCDRIRYAIRSLSQPDGSAGVSVGPGAMASDPYDLANMLRGYVDRGTPPDIAAFLLDQSKAAVALADFTALPFADDQFALVVFDPPHLVGNGRSGWLAKKYGKLGAAWRDDLRAGFAECFRVLRPDGTLIFKWNEHEIPVRDVLALTPEKPLFGNRCGKTAKSHWLVFMKRAAGSTPNA